MSITADELNALTSTPTQSAPAPESVQEPAPAPVRIAGWAEELPRPKRHSPFDTVIDELRRIGDTTRFARLEWEGKTISPNRVNQLRKRYPDCEFNQVTQAGEKQTWVRFKGQGS